jgi:hypothetical protein
MRGSSSASFDWDWPQCAVERIDSAAIRVQENGARTQRAPFVS